MLAMQGTPPEGLLKINMDASTRAVEALVKYLYTGKIFFFNTLLQNIAISYIRNEWNFRKSMRTFWISIQNSYSKDFLANFYKGVGYLFIKVHF